MKHRLVLNCASCVLFGFLLGATNGTAQTMAYRQTNQETGSWRKALWNQTTGEVLHRPFEPAGVTTEHNKVNHGSPGLSSSLNPFVGYLILVR